MLTDFGSAAVLDRETGVVWERAPVLGIANWGQAHMYCNGHTVGGRKGWRLPTVQELASLIDPNNPDGNPDLPPGHPFIDLGPLEYWSATASSNDASFAWFVHLGDGGVSWAGKGNWRWIWCVRGGQGVDFQ